MITRITNVLRSLMLRTRICILKTRVGKTTNSEVVNEALQQIVIGALQLIVIGVLLDLLALGVIIGL